MFANTREGTMTDNGQPRSEEWQRADWFAYLVRRALRETDDAELALRSAEMAIDLQPLPGEPLEDPHAPTVAALSIDAYLSHDIHDRKAQAILDRAMRVIHRFSYRASKDLEQILKNRGTATLARNLERWADKWKLKLAGVLTATQLASLLAGARQVARNVPLSPPRGVRDAALPASLSPEDAVRLLRKLGNLEPGQQEEAVYALPPDQQAYVRVALQMSRQPPPPPITPRRPPRGSPEGMHWPVIDEAAGLLARKNLMTRPEFDRLAEAARAKAFTVAGVNATETLDKIRKVIVKQVEKGVDVKDFKKNVLKEVEEGTFLSDAHMETVFRTNVQSAFTDGTNEILKHPFVASGFPYAAYEPIHDDRVREDHKALEKLGISGTNVYRRDDPVFQKYTPPWDFSCRCSWIPLTVRMAADRGVPEARKWLDRGLAPEHPAFVKDPEFQPSPSFARSLNAAPLSIQLSMTPITTWKTRRRKRNIDAQFDAWTQYRGPEGGQGWKNAATGEVRYQRNRPSESGGQTGDTPSEGSGDSQSKIAAAVARVKDNVAKLSAIADKIPGVGHVKKGVQALMGGIHKKLAGRYGEKAATAIMTSGGLGGYGVMAAAQALVGFPGVPIVNDLISIAAHTAVAEVVLQLGRAKTAAGFSLDQDEMAKEVVAELAAGLKKLLEANYGDIAKALEDQDAKTAVTGLLMGNQDILKRDQ